MTVSTLDTAPQTTPTRDSAWGAASTAEPVPHRPFGVLGDVITRTHQPDYPAWLRHVQAAAGCTRPVRLAGVIDTIDPTTGHRVGRLHTDAMPDAAIYKACGNRRHRVCPSCAGTYQRDAYQVVRTMLIGGKGVPATVAGHGAVFATFTAPSFGTVHARIVRQHRCENRRRCDCRPDPCHPRRDAGLCGHGAPAVCWVRHDPDDPVLGRPLCLDCYDHAHQVVWNLAAGQLWHRTKQNIERHLATLCRQRRIPFHRVTTIGADGKRRTRYVAPVRVAHGKAAEFQTRAAVHFHALLRLDGVNPADPADVIPPPAGLGVDDLIAAVRHAATVTDWTTPDHPDQPGGWHIAWGDPDKGLDIQPITFSGRGEISDSMVAGYLAKYATKSTEATGHLSTRITAETIDLLGDPDGDHTARLIDACWHLGRPTAIPVPLGQRPHRPRQADRLSEPWTCPDCRTRTRLAICPSCQEHRQLGLDTKPAKPRAGTFYHGLRRWAHMLGFGGHFLTKARHHRVTFGLLRDTRTLFRRHSEREHQAGQPIRATDHVAVETTLIVGILSYAGTGWHTTGDALLATTAADQARRRHHAGREELDHETGTAFLAATAAVAA